jgi:ribosomal protein S18 acetylase RimI-like enzyme
MEVKRFTIKQRNQLKQHIPLLVTMCDYFTPLNTWMADKIQDITDVFYAVKGNTILGYVLADNQKTHLEIELICVGPEGRLMKGIGKKLMQACEKTAKEYNLPEIQLDAQLNAEGFYKHLGYTNIHRNNTGVRMKKNISKE